MKFALKRFLATTSSVLALLLMPQHGSAQQGCEIKGSVLSVNMNRVDWRALDGDTFSITDPKTGMRMDLRLRGIDAPETPKRGKGGQPYSIAAAKALHEMLDGASALTCTLTGKSYGRDVAICHDERNMDFGVRLVREGMAYHDPEFTKTLGCYRDDLEAAEEEARKAKRGVWVLPNAERPWYYRNRMKQDRGPEK